MLDTNANANLHLARWQSSWMPPPCTTLLTASPNDDPASPDEHRATRGNRVTACSHQLGSASARCQLAEKDDAATASAAAGVLGMMPGVRDPSLNSRCHCPWSWHALAGRLRAYVDIVDDVGAIC